MARRNRNRPRPNRLPRPYAKQKRAWGISERGGQRVFLKELVEDGQYPGLMVTRDERDPRHPQEFPIYASDAIALERPSPERTYFDAVVELPTYQRDNPAEKNWIPATKVALGKLTVQVTDTPSEQLLGNVAKVRVGSILPEISTSDRSVFLVGNRIRARQGTLIINASGSDSALLTGVESRVRIGTISVTVGGTTTLVGNRAGVSVGTILALSSTYVRSTFDNQFNGASLRAVGQRQ